MSIIHQTKSKRNPIVLQLNEFQGHRLLDIRRFFWDQKTSEYKPTKKGISLNRENYAEIMSMILERSESIASWLGFGNVDNAANKVLSSLRNDSEQIDAAKAKIERILEDTEYSEFSDRRFAFPYSFEARGSKCHVAKNIDHPIHNASAEDSSNINSESVGRVIDAVFEAYFRASRRLEAVTPDGYVNLETLESEWDRELRLSIATAAEHSGNE